MPQNLGQLTDICISCKTKVVDFFVFKRRNEEARKIFKQSSAFDPPVKNMLLQVVDQLDTVLTSPDESQDEVTEWCHEDHVLTMDESNEDFLDPSEPEVMQDESNISFEESQASVEVFEGPSDVPNDPTPPATPSKSKYFRSANPKAWIRNKRKLAKNTGASYVASNGKFIQAKQMKSNCGPSCRMQCSKKISDENRLVNFDFFYRLADIAKQRKFLFDHMKTFEPKRSKVPKNPLKVRAVQRYYFLDLTHGNGAREMLQVCKLMFLNTFSISSQMIDTLYRKATSEGKFSDARGKFERKQSKAHDFCVQHVEKLPSAQLELNLSAAKMYELYVKECQVEKVEPLKESNYREIYNKHCNLLTDKSGCTICGQFHNATSDEQAALQDEFDEHLADNKTCWNRPANKRRKVEEPDGDVDGT